LSIRGAMRNRRRLARSVDMGPLQDAFLVSAVVMILIIRLQLWATNYPQLGGGKLHIAHLLWGGLFMLIAVGLLVSFVGRGTRLPAAIVGGIGFGFFIDELGKFITSDNDYFFQPAAAIIYLVFIALYLFTRWMQRSRGLSDREYLVNAIDSLAEAARGELNERDKQRILNLLQRADPDDPMTRQLRDLVAGLDAVPTPQANPAARFALAIRRRYERVVEHPRFVGAVSALFCIWAFVIGIAGILLIVAAGLKIGGFKSTEVAIGDDTNVTFTDWASVGASLAAGAFVIWGVVRLRAHRRLDAYYMFERALLVEIFIGYFFEFLRIQFTAVFGLTLSLLLLITVRYMIRSEQHLRQVQALEGSAGEGERPPPTGERLAPAQLG
jgi:hypothetical protein